MKTKTLGHCPFCGNQWAVVRGRMSHHGYTIEHGWFEGACGGRQFGPIEVNADPAREVIEDIKADIEKAKARIVRLMNGEEVLGAVKHPNLRKVTINFADLKPFEQREVLESVIRQIGRRNDAGEQLVGHLSKAIAEFEGKPLVEVAVESKSAAIAPGDTVKVHGIEVVVTKLEYAEARGVGPFMNGRYVEHVYWQDEQGREVRYPKRYARKV